MANDILIENPPVTSDFAAAFDEIDFSELRRDDSPSHDSQSSGVFSPVRLNDDDQEEVHDADSDSSNHEQDFDPFRLQRKTKRRTSSNVFTFKKNETTTCSKITTNNTLSSSGITNTNNKVLDEYDVIQDLEKM